MQMNVSDDDNGDDDDAYCASSNSASQNDDYDDINCTLWMKSELQSLFLL